MIKLGVTSCFMYPDLGRTVFGAKSLCYIEKDMANYLSRPGVMPILIPDLEESGLGEFLEELDGIVLEGGSDIAPQTFGEEPIENGRWPGDPYRDEYELKILDYAIRNNKPVFGICRGLQLLNVYFGGTLYQDIATQVPDAMIHRDAIIYDQLNHDISFTHGKLLERLHSDEPVMKVNTIHHQAIKDLGKNLTVQATSDNGRFIEAFTWDKARPGKVIGVQWHPEFFYNSKEKLIDEEKVYSHFLSYL